MSCDQLRWPAGEGGFVKNRNVVKKNRKTGRIGVLALIVIAIVAVLAFLAVAMLTGNLKFGSKEAQSESTTVKLRLQDIGQLNTQEAYVTEVNATKDAKQLFGVDVPFTQSTLIYSYNFRVTAGYDFSQIDLEEKPAGSSDGKSTVIVYLPAVEITGTEPVKDSLKVYEEKESVFNRISLDENDEALSNMRDQAEKDAISNGLLDAAEDNAKTLLSSFLLEAYPSDQYTIEFQDKQDAGSTDEENVNAQSTSAENTNAQSTASESTGA